MLTTVAKAAGGAGSTVIVLVAVMVLAQLSVKVQVSVYVPPQLLCEPVIVDVTLPLIRQLPVPLLVYDNEVGNGAVAIQLIVVSLTAANVAVSAGRMVISLEVLIVLLQLSVNVQVSV